MIEGLKRLTKHSFIYAIGSGIQGIAGLLLIPVYTKTLSVADYGQYELLNTISLILVSVLSLGFASAYIKTAERDINKEKEKKKLAGTAVFFVLIFATTLLLILSLFVDPIASVFNFGKTTYLYIIFASALALIIGNLGFSMLRSNEQSIKYTVIYIIRFLLILGLNVTLVLVFKKGIEGILTGLLLANSITLLLLLPTFFKNVSFTFSKKLFKKLLVFGLAIIPASLALWVMDLIDRYFINHYHGFAEVGVYSLAYKFGIAMAIMLVTPFQLAWPTVSFSLADKPDARKMYGRVLTYFVTIALFIALTFTFFSTHIIRIIATNAYEGASIIVLPVTLSYVFLGIHYIVVVGLHLKERSHLYPILIVFPALLNIILNYLLVPPYGMIGAAITTFISFLFMGILTVALVQKYYAFVYEKKRLVIAFFAAALALSVHLLFKSSLLPIDLMIQCVSLTLFVLILILFKFFTKKEVFYVKQLPHYLKTYATRRNHSGSK
ncbi:oligosaccharide flippase family protein [Patescibacteria group bacterium]|nr:oligosaccharide flippase family protein [Patescibacteria group bacterium]